MLVLLLVGALLQSAVLHAASQQQQPVSEPTTAPQLLPAPVTLVADYYDDDATAACTTSVVVSVSVDGLLAWQRASVQATVIASLNLAPSQLLEAAVFSAAGLSVLLFQSSGEEERHASN